METTMHYLINHRRNVYLASSIDDCVTKIKSILIESKTSPRKLREGVGFNLSPFEYSKVRASLRTRGYASVVLKDNSEIEITRAIVNSIISQKSITSHDDAAKTI